MTPWRLRPLARHSFYRASIRLAFSPVRLARTTNREKFVVGFPPFTQSVYSSVRVLNPGVGEGEAVLLNPPKDSANKDEQTQKPVGKP